MFFVVLQYLLRTGNQNAFEFLYLSQKWGWLSKKNIEFHHKQLFICSICTTSVEIHTKHPLQTCFLQVLQVGRLHISAIGSINSHDFHRGWENQPHSVGVYIPIIRIPCERWDEFTPNIRSLAQWASWMIQDLTCRAPAQLWMSGSSDKDDSKIGDIFSYKRKDGVDIFANVSSDQPMVNWWFGARWFGFPGSPKLKGFVT